MNNFHCPIHNTSEYNTVHVACHIDSWDDYYCSECLKENAKIQEIKKWFYSRCTSKVSGSLKKELKNSFIDVYHQSDNGLENYSRIGYLTVKDRSYIFYAHVYSYSLSWMLKKLKEKPKPKYRMFIETLNKFNTIDIEADSLPYHLLNDNNFLLKALK